MLPSIKFYYDEQRWIIQIIVISSCYFLLQEFKPKFYLVILTAILLQLPTDSCNLFTPFASYNSYIVTQSLLHCFYNELLNSLSLKVRFSPFSYMSHFCSHLFSILIFSNLITSIWVPISKGIQFII